MRVLTVVIALVAGSASLARARGGALFIPPIEVDAGTGAPIGEPAAVTGATTEMLIGLHWASLAWMPTPIELGVGYIEHSQALASPEFARTTMRVDEHLRLSGGYFTVGYAVVQHRHWRTWLAARGELLKARMPDREFSTRGGAVRLATELFASVHGMGGHGGAGGIIAGTFAIGFYIEAARRELPQELGATEVTAGLTFRLPLIAVAAN